jgi:hypothetical protein
MNNIICKGRVSYPPEGKKGQVKAALNINSRKNENRASPEPLRASALSLRAIPLLSLRATPPCHCEQ